MNHGHAGNSQDMPGLTVAVTGPTGEIGQSAVLALEARPEVERIIGMARRPFDPKKQGWTKTVFRQGDILDRAAVDALVTDADIVIHLAYVIMGSREESRKVNLTGTRNVFEASAAAERTRRLVYTSSVAAYGYHRDNPVPITEDVPPRGSPEHYYSEQKAECEALLHEVTDGSGLEVYVLRPCIVAGAKAPALWNAMPWRQIGDRVPELVRKAIAAVPLARPVLPDPGVPVQLDQCLPWRVQPWRGRHRHRQQHRRRFRSRTNPRSARRRDCPVRDLGAAAPSAIGGGVATRDARLDRHGQHQGETRTRLATSLHERGDTPGPRTHHQLHCLSRHDVPPALIEPATFRSYDTPQAARHDRRL